MVDIQEITELSNQIVVRQKEVLSVVQKVDRAPKKSFSPSDRSFSLQKK